MTNDEVPNDERMTNDEARMTKKTSIVNASRNRCDGHSNRLKSDIRISSLIRHSSFVIRHCAAGRFRNYAKPW